MKNHHHLRGQSLVELLIGIAIGSILIVAAGSVIAPALRTNKQVDKVQTSAALAKALLDNLTVWSGSDWHNVLALSTGTSYSYYLNTSSSPFTAASGTESVTVSTSTYTRYFYVTDVYRDTNGNITVSGGSYDPSTKQVTVVYGWPQGTTSTISLYITRSRQTIYDQTDWSGGPGQNGPQTTTNLMFASSTNIDYSTTTGSIYVSIPGY